LIIKKYTNNKKHKNLSTLLKILKLFMMHTMLDKHVVLFLLLFFSNASGLEISINQETALEIGKKIWINECAGSVDKLVFWNPHEDCISLGIGHFIWYPEQAGKKFDSMFPEYLAFLKTKQTPLPKILANAAHAPWKTREEFLAKEKTEEIILLKKWLSETVDFQTEFIVNRISISLNRILTLDPHLDKPINQLINTPAGLFALIDYLNFKGEGLSQNERYEGKGWGLYQVLLGMNEKNGTPLDRFKASAISALTERVRLAPKDESRWLPGWTNRIKRY